MSLTEFQKDKVKVLLATDFKKQYDLIPDEFKSNTFFEEFLFKLAEIYRKVNNSIRDNYKGNTDFKTNTGFSMSEDEKNFYTKADYFVQVANLADGVSDKDVMVLTLGKDGSLYLSWTFAFVHGKPYIPENDDCTYELSMKLNDSKSRILVEHMVTSRGNKPYKCFLSSVFDTNASEIARTSEAINTENNMLYYHEEFTPVGMIDFKKLKEWQTKAKYTPLTLLGIISDSLSLEKDSRHPNVKELFAVRCELKEKTRYAICWKPDHYIDQSFQQSFESISRFGAPGANISTRLDAGVIQWLLEISEKEYNSLISNAPQIEIPQLRIALK